MNSVEILAKRLKSYINAGRRSLRRVGYGCAAALCRSFTPPPAAELCPRRPAICLLLQHKLADPVRTSANLRESLNRTITSFKPVLSAHPCFGNVLSENGMHDLSERLLLNEEYPGWLHEVNLGATTIWERWNSLDENGQISSTGMNSLNHYSYGSIFRMDVPPSGRTSAHRPRFYCCTHCSKANLEAA